MLIYEMLRKGIRSLKLTIQNLATELNEWYKRIVRIYQLGKIRKNILSFSLKIPRTYS